MAQSHIEWTEMTWNPTTGCTKISQGCKFCYAEIMSKRLKAMGMEKYKDEFKVRTHTSELSTPYKWKRSKVVFVNLYELKTIGVLVLIYTWYLSFTLLIEIDAHGKIFEQLYLRLETKSRKFKKCVL